MSKLFTEFPLPVKREYQVLVRVMPEETYDCAWPDCATNDMDDASFWSPEVYQCDCCGQWFCLDHMHVDQIYCLECWLFPEAMREAIMAFRARLSEIG